jgi:hypothetical protein
MKAEKLRVDTRRNNEASRDAVRLTMTGADRDKERQRIKHLKENV